MATKEELGRALQAAHDAGDEEAAATLAAAFAAASEEKSMSMGDIATGVGDVALSAARGTAHQLVGTAFGVGNMLRGEPYMKGKKLYDDIASGAVSDPENPNPLAIGPANLHTPQGERVASAISNAPGIKQINKAIERLGAGIEEYAGPEARDVATSAATLLTAGVPEGRMAVTDAARAVKEMRNVGYITTPTAQIGNGAFAGTRTERALNGLTNANDLIAVKNQALTDRLGAKAGGLPEGTTTTSAVNRATDEATKAYEQIKKVTAPIRLQGDPVFLSDVGSIGKRVIGSNEPIDAAIEKMQHNLLTSKMNVSGIVDRISELRDESYLNKKTEKPKKVRLGMAQREAADALEGSLDRFFKRAAARHPNTPVSSLYPAWTAARERLSTLHVIRDSMNETTGTLDASKVAKEAVERGMDKIHPALRLIARAYQADSPALRVAEKAAKSAGTVPVSAVSASVGAGVGASIGGVPGAIIGALAPSVARILSREYIARGKAARLTTRAIADANRNAARGIVAEESADDQQ